MKYQKHGNQDTMTDSAKDNGQNPANGCAANIIMTKHLDAMENEKTGSTDFMSNVYEIIEKYNLTQKNRKQTIIYKRYFLYYQLQKAKLSLSHIGLLFKKDHASVIHGIKMHKRFTKMKDAIYLNHIQSVVDELNHVPETRNLRNDILNCQSMDELLIIKTNIERNLY